MARILSQTLARRSQTLIHDSSGGRLLASPAARREGRRGRASQPEKAEHVAVDLETEETRPDAESLRMRRVENAVYRVIVRRYAPDWLPFIPGSSYWVPPMKRRYGVAELIGTLASSMTEQTLSFTSDRSWPSAAYFPEVVSPHPVKKSPEKAAAESDDEES